MPTAECDAEIGGRLQVRQQILVRCQAIDELRVHLDLRFRRTQPGPVVDHRAGDPSDQGKERHEAGEKHGAGEDVFDDPQRLGPRGFVRLIPQLPEEERRVVRHLRMLPEEGSERRI